LLLLRETQLHHAAPINQQTAMYGSAPNTGNGGYGQSYSNNNNNTGGGRYHGKKKNTHYTNNSGGGHPDDGTFGGGGYRAPDPRPAPVGPWVCFNPATGVAQQMASPAWHPAGGPGVLGPRPNASRPPSHGPAQYHGPPQPAPQ
jgi:hypothetical protein